MNPVIRGWMTRYSKFHRTELDGFLRPDYLVSETQFRKQ